MDEATTRLVEQLKSNPAMLQQLMQSRDGQALMQMLTRNESGQPPCRKRPSPPFGAIPLRWCSW